MGLLLSSYGDGSLVDPRESSSGIGVPCLVSKKEFRLGPQPVETLALLLECIQQHCQLLSGTNSLSPHSAFNDTGPPQPQVPQLRLAVSIGNDGYTTLERLSNAGRDARAIAARLHQLGFEVLRRDTADGFCWDSTPAAVHVANADARDFRRIIRALYGRVEAASPSCQLITFWYFSGHGFEIDGVPYMVPIEQAQTDERVPDWTSSKELDFNLVNKVHTLARPCIRMHAHMHTYTHTRRPKVSWTFPCA